MKRGSDNGIVYLSLLVPLLLLVGGLSYMAQRLGAGTPAPAVTRAPQSSLQDDMPLTMANWEQRMTAAARARAAQPSSRQFPLTEINLTPNSPGNELHPDWSQLGSIAFESNSAPNAQGNGFDPTNLSTTGYDIWTMDRFGGNIKRVIALPGDQTNPRWSPDGNRIAFINQAVNPPQIYTVDVNTLQITDITGSFPYVNPTTGNVDPQPVPGVKRGLAWSPDGSWLLFCTNVDVTQYPSQATPLNGDDIFMVNVTGKLIRRLTTYPGNDDNPAFSVAPGGIPKVAWTSEQTGQKRIWVMDFVDANQDGNGDNPVQITTGGGDPNAQDDYATWLYDPTNAVASQTIAFASTRVATNSQYGTGDTTGGDYNVYRLSTATPETTGGTPILITNQYQPDGNKDDFEPEFSRLYQPTPQREILLFATNRTRNLAQPGSTDAQNPNGSFDIWSTNTLDSTAPLLIPSVVGGVTYSVFDPGVPFSAPRKPRSPADGLFHGDDVTISCVIKELESGLTTPPSGQAAPAPHNGNADAGADQDGSASAAVRNWNVKAIITQPDTPALRTTVSNVGLIPDPNGACIFPRFNIPQTPFTLPGANLTDPNSYAANTVAIVNMDIYDDGPPPQGHELEDNAVAGDQVYFCTCTYKTGSRPTDINPGDYYVSFFTRDRAGNAMTYDNIWGYSTQPFDKSASLLLVNDYMAGQAFVRQALGGVSFNRQIQSQVPVEPYWTFLENTPGFPLAGNEYFNGRMQEGLTAWANTFRKIDPRISQWRIQCRGPLTEDVISSWLPQRQTLVDNIDKQQMDVMQAEKAIWWAAPYPGDIFAGKGTIMDPAQWTMIQNYIAAGGRIALTGHDVAWALTQNGTLSNPLLEGSFGVKYVTDTCPLSPADPAAANIMVQGAFSHDDIIPFPQNGTPRNNTVAVPLLWDSSGAGTDETCSISPDVRKPPQDCSRSQSFYWPIGLIDRYNVVGANSVAGFTIGGQTVASYTQDPFPNGTSNGARTAFMSLAPELIHPDYQNGSFNNTPTAWSEDQRQKILHFVSCWMRTTRVFGKVTDNSTNEALQLVRLNVISNQTGKIMSFARTDSQGNYEAIGLPADQYTVVPEPGVLGFFDHPPNWDDFHGGTLPVSGFGYRLTPAPNGGINGIVYDRDPAQGGIPTANITVLLYSNTPDPLTGQIVIRTTTTDVNGKFSFNDVKTGSYTLVANPKNNSATDTDFPVQNGQVLGVPPGYTKNTKYGTASQNVTVQTAVNTNVVLILGVGNGSVTGRVLDDTTGQPITTVPVLIEALLNGTPQSLNAKGDTQIQADPTTGQFTLTLLAIPSAQYQITATAQGYLQGTKTTGVDTANPTDVGDIRLQKRPPQPDGFLAGTVLSATTGQPIGGVTLTVLNGDLTPPTQVATAQSDGTLSGGVNFRISLPPTDPVNGPKSYILTASKAGFATQSVTGITIQSGQTTTEQIQMTSLHTFASGISMVSLPFDYGNVPPETVKSFPSNLQLAAYNPALANTAQPYAFRPTPPADRWRLGQGYFIKLAAPADLTDATGTPAPTTTRFPIPVLPGWNLIGNPFPYEVDWVSTQVKTATTLMSLQDAFTAGIIRNGLFTYNGSGYDLATTLLPYSGYWVKATQTAQLLIDPAPVQRSRQHNTTTGIDQYVGRALSSGDGWALRLVATAGAVQDAANFAGVATRAADSYDTYDIAKPPDMNLGPYVSLSFVHGDWGADSGRYAVDLRSPIAKDKSWDIEVVSNLDNTPVTITWPDLSSMPRQYRAYLIDLDGGASRYMRTTSSYTFTPGRAYTPRRFRLQITSAADSDLRVTNITQAPGRSSGGTRFSFNLSQSCDVTLHVINLAGRVVAEIKLGNRAAGLNDVMWDGRDSQGRVVPKGPYLLTVVAADPQTGRAYQGVHTINMR